MNLVKFLGHLIKSAEVPMQMVRWYILSPFFIGKQKRLGEVIGTGGKETVKLGCHACLNFDFLLAELTLCKLWGFDRGEV